MNTSGPLSRSDLMSLEEYAQRRSDYRQQVISHKKNRQIPVGPNARLYFEDRFTMQYQIQEILRIEKVFEADAIEEELEAYNPLIPNGSNWKATFMIEYPDEHERRVALSELIGIERKTWVQVEGFDPVFAIANEDLVRETEEKTSAVHFLRFELQTQMIEAAKRGANILMGIDHENYHYATGPIADNIADSLRNDLALRH